MEEKILLNVEELEYPNERKEPCMLALKPTTKNHLFRIVSGMTRDLWLREDLMQEALVHFWKVECRRPGQSLSWYLQSCSFHLRHYLAAGRSIDSSKRRSLLSRWPDEEETRDWLRRPSVDSPVLARVQVREILYLLSRELTPRQQAVLRCLAQGLGPREIARRLRFSHPVVIKYRRQIATLAIRLGIDAWPTRRAGRGPRRVNDSVSTKIIQLPTHPTTGTVRNGKHRRLANGHTLADFDAMVALEDG
jgi:DNA-directed RNA polymerase specialized sigma24 family protein